jgi:hypothetical protein
MNEFIVFLAVFVFAAFVTMRGFQLIKESPQTRRDEAPGEVWVSFLGIKFRHKGEAGVAAVGLGVFLVLVVIVLYYVS